MRTYWIVAYACLKSSTLRLPTECEPGDVLIVYDQISDSLVGSLIVVDRRTLKVQESWPSGYVTRKVLYGMLHRDHPPWMAPKPNRLPEFHRLVGHTNGCTELAWDASQDIYKALTIFCYYSSPSFAAPPCCYSSEEQIDCS